MEDIISEYDQGNPESVNGESCNERSYNDDLLETRSESDIPVRPPRPSKYGTKLFKNLSMDELELRSNDPGMTDFSRTEFEDTLVTTQDYDEKEDFVQFQVSVNSDERLALSARYPKDEDDVKLTEDVDQSSSVSESSTLTTDGELSFENGSLHDKQKESTSEGDDDTLIYYQESNESVGTRNSAADSTKRQSKTDSDYVRVYDDIHTYDRNQKVTNIHSVQEEEAPNTIATKNAKTTNGEAGMIHVAADENKQYTAGLSNEKDGVSLNVPVSPGVQHLDFHFHININFASGQRHSTIPDTNANHSDMTGNQNATHTKSTKRNDSPRQMVASSLSTVVKPKPEIPAAPPVPKQKEIAGRRMPKRSNTLPTKLAERPSKSKTRSFGRNLGRVWKSIPLRKEPEEIEDYDEIDEKLQPKEMKKLSTKDGSKSSMHSLPTVLDEEQPDWLYEHQSSKQAEESIRTDKNGSFAVIQEDPESMPFTPYTLLVVHERQLLRIPVIKHRPVPIIRNLFTQSGTFRAKDSFSLAASPGDKMKSIEDVVAYYQKHELGGIKLKLIPAP